MPLKVIINAKHSTFALRRFRASQCSRHVYSQKIRFRAHSRHVNGAGDSFTAAKTEEEWLQLDEKVNTYPSTRTFKAIGVGGQDFVDSIISAVEKAANQTIDRRAQVSERPSKEGSYLAVSITKVNVHSGKQVLHIYREMKLSGGGMLKYII